MKDNILKFIKDNKVIISLFIILMAVHLFLPLNWADDAVFLKKAADKDILTVLRKQSCRKGTWCENYGVWRLKPKGQCKGNIADGKSADDISEPVELFINIKIGKKADSKRYQKKYNNRTAYELGVYLSCRLFAGRIKRLGKFGKIGVANRSAAERTFFLAVFKLYATFYTVHINHLVLCCFELQPQDRAPAAGQKSAFRARHPVYFE